MMAAIAHGAHIPDGGRGRPPASVAAKYTSPGKDAPDQSGKDHGGNWNEHHHHKAKEREEKKSKSKKDLKKAFADYYKGQAAAALIMDNNGRVLLGKHVHGGLAFPGGHVDAGDANYEIAALREMKEECGLLGHNPQKIYEFKHSGNHCTVYLIESFTGKVKGCDEIKDWKWFEPQDIPWDKLRDCCVEPLKYMIKEKMGKSLKGMLSIEILEKNIIRQRGDAVFEVTHGDALKLVGNGMFRKLRKEVAGMTDESFKDFNIDTHVISIRKHMNDVYSGRVSDGHKVVYQFTNKSLPEVTAALMSVFEWYMPDDEHDLELLDDISDDAIEGGINSLMDNYKRHNIGNIYQEMETIREQMRNGVAVDLQQVEGRIMKLFDKLEEMIHEVASKHNELGEKAGKEVDDIEIKLRQLQSKIDEMASKPQTVEAFSTRPANPTEVHNNNYPYLPRPQVEIFPDGKIKISFASEWTSLDRENFLSDMRARTLKRVGRVNDK